MITFNDFINKQKKIAVIGLGYVGLPIALEFAKHYKVIGFDINDEKIKLLQKKIDPNKEIDSAEFDNSDIIFTSNPDELKQANFFIVSVPTPIDEYNKPDLTALLNATKIVAKYLKKGDIVVYESTVYPGCTEEDCMPILEKISGLSYISDFKIGYSPERINPGDKEHTITKITKIVAGCDDEALNLISEIYGRVIKAGIYKASSIKVAEAAKIIENTQRDINIGLMNELAIIFHLMGINTYEVIEAASTKWNFLKFYPGLVGGHCIGVDPYYLTYKSAKLGYHAQLITAGRFINDSMGHYIAREAIKKLINIGKDIRTTKAIILGFTFKENIHDIRNTKVIDIYNELVSFGLKNIQIHDPYANPDEVLKEYGIGISDKLEGKYDLIIASVAHKYYCEMKLSELESISFQDTIIIDIRNIFKKYSQNFNYWCL